MLQRRRAIAVAVVGYPPYSCTASTAIIRILSRTSHGAEELHVGDSWELGSEDIIESLYTRSD
jgi:hypothetical protein